MRYQDLTRAKNLGSLVLSFPSPSLSGFLNLKKPGSLEQPIRKASKVSLGIDEWSRAQNDIKPNLETWTQKKQSSNLLGFEDESPKICPALPLSDIGLGLMGGPLHICLRLVKLSTLKNNQNST